MMTPQWTQNLDFSRQRRLNLEKWNLDRTTDDLVPLILAIDHALEVFNAQRDIEQFLQEVQKEQAEYIHTQQETFSPHDITEQQQLYDDFANFVRHQQDNDDEEKPTVETTPTAKPQPVNKPINIQPEVTLPRQEVAFTVQTLIYTITCFIEDQQRSPSLTLVPQQALQ